MLSTEILLPVLRRKCLGSKFPIRKDSVSLQDLQVRSLSLLISRHLDEKSHKTGIDRLIHGVKCKAIW